MKTKEKIKFLETAGFEVHHYKDGDWQELTIERHNMEQPEPIVLYNSSVDKLSVSEMIDLFMTDYKEDVILKSESVYY